MPNIVPNFYLDLDTTGVSPANKIVLERYTLPSTVVKCIIPNYGAYYTNTLEVYSISTFNGVSILLERELDYKCVEMLPQVSADIGSEICFVILLIRSSASTEIEITYQALGGSDSPNRPLMMEIYRQMTAAMSGIEWDDILHKPDEYPPAHHLHDSADVYGLDPITDELKWIKADIELADNKIHSYILNKLDYINAKANSIEFKAIENIDINAQVQIIDNAKANLASANRYLNYIQLKYNLAEKFFTRVNNLRIEREMAGPPLTSSSLNQPTFTLIPSKTSVYEGDNLDFNLLTTDSVDGTVYKIKSYRGYNNDLTTITSVDLDTVYENIITVNKNVGVATVSITRDNIIEGNRFLTYGLYDQNDTLLALSRTVVVNDSNITTEIRSRFMPADPYFNKVTLLLKGDGAIGSTVVKDSSMSPNVITAYGDLVNGTTYTDLGGGSLKFDGAGDYLRISPSTSVVLGVNDFTIEAFMYFNNTDTGGFGNMCTYIDPLNTYGISVSILNGKINVKIGRSISDSFYEIKGKLSVIKYTWYHIAVTRAAGVVRLFINGLLDSSIVNTTNLNNKEFVVGRTYPTNESDYFNGYIDELRITKGLARYISNFISPMPILPPDVLDPYRNNTNLYLKGNGVDASTFIEDSGIQVHSVKSLTGAKISSTQYVTGKSSIYFKGNALNCPYIEHSDSLDLFNVNNWTIEFYVYLTSDASLFILDKDGIAGKAFPQYRITVNNTFISLMLGTGNGNAATQLFITPKFQSITNKWVHFAAVNTNKTIYLFVDGTKVLASPITITMSSGGSNLNIGTEAGQKWEFDAYIDELRITKGVARYIYNFAPFTTDTIFEELRVGSISQNILISNNDVLNYSVVATKSNVFENEMVTFVVTTNDTNHNGYVDVTINKVTDTFSVDDYQVFDLAPTKLYIKDGLGKYDIYINKDLLTELDEQFKVCIWKLNKYNVPLAVSANVTIIDSPNVDKLQNIYLITSDKYSIMEGQSVSFKILTPVVPNGTTLYYALSSSINSSDVYQNTWGTVTVVNNKASLTISAILDTINEPIESFFTLLFTDSNGTNMVAASNSVEIVNVANNVNPPVYVIRASTTSLNEGSSVTFTIDTENVSNGTVLYYEINGLVDSTDFNEPLNSNITINNNTAFFTLTAKNDNKTEGVETFNVILYTSSIKNTFLVTGPTVTINDTSKAVSCTITPDRYTINEGDTIAFTINTTNISNNTILYYEIMGLADSQDITIPFTGTCTINNNLSDISFTFIKDALVDDVKHFNLALYLNDTRVHTLAISSPITVIDVSIAYVIPTMRVSLNSGKDSLKNMSTTDFRVSLNHGIDSLYAETLHSIPLNVSIGSSSFNNVISEMPLMLGGYVSTVGDAWDIVLTYTGGRNWRKVKSNSDGTIFAALNDVSYLYVSRDGGATATMTAGGAPAVFNSSIWWTDVTGNTDWSKMYATVQPERVYKSDDFGISWQPMVSAGTAAWRTISCSSDGSKIVIGGSLTRARYSNDSGVTWSDLSVAGATEKYWADSAMSSDGSKIVLCENASDASGYIHTSSDFGATWTQRTNAGLKSWRSVSMSSDGSKIIAATFEYIYMSNDSGATWTAITSLGSRFWASVSMSSDGSKIIAVPGLGDVYFTTDGGATWTTYDGQGLNVYWTDAHVSADGNMMFTCNSYVGGRGNVLISA